MTSGLTVVKGRATKTHNHLRPVEKLRRELSLNSEANVWDTQAKIYSTVDMNTKYTIPFPVFNLVTILSSDPTIKPSNHPSL